MLFSSRVHFDKKKSFCVEAKKEPEKEVEEQENGRSCLNGKEEEGRERNKKYEKERKIEKEELKKKIQLKKVLERE